MTGAIAGALAHPRSPLPTCCAVPACRKRDVSKKVAGKWAWVQGVNDCRLSTKARTATAFTHLHACKWVETTLHHDPVRERHCGMAFCM